MKNKKLSLFGKYFVLPNIVCLLAGLAMSLAYPPYSRSSLIWGGLGLFLAGIWLLPYRYAGKQSGAKLSVKYCLKRFFFSAFLRGGICGYAFFVFSLNWLSYVSIVALLALPCLMSIYFGMFATFASSVAKPYLRKILSERGKQKIFINPSLHSIRCSFLVAICWAGLEWIREVFLTGFGWNTLGVALHSGYAPLVQICDLFGTKGLSFIIVFVTSLIFLSMWRLILEVKERKFHPHLDFFTAIGVLLLCFFYGIHKLSERSHKLKNADKYYQKLNILCIQPNIPQKDKWDESRLQDHLAQLQAYTMANLDIADGSETNEKRIDLVVWPETSIPDYFSPFRSWLEKLAEQIGVTFAFGVIRADYDTRDIYNSIGIYNHNLLKHKAEPKFYYKMHLVPFGEFIPLRFMVDIMRYIEPNIPEGIDYSRGQSSTPIPIICNSKKYSLIPTICFEDTLNRVARVFVRPEPQIILNLTNDSWFGESQAAEQHFVNAIFRSIELRRPLIRCTNTGVTALIDEYGFIVNELRQNGKTFFTGSMLAEANLPIASEAKVTFFARFGDVFAIIAFIYCFTRFFIKIVKKGVY